MRRRAAARSSGRRSSVRARPLRPAAAARRAASARRGRPHEPLEPCRSSFGPSAASTSCPPRAGRSASARAAARLRRGGPECVSGSRGGSPASTQAAAVPRCSARRFLEECRDRDGLARRAQLLRCGERSRRAVSFAGARSCAVPRRHLSLPRAWSSARRRRWSSQPAAGAAGCARLGGGSVELALTATDGACSTARRPGRAARDRPLGRRHHPCGTVWRWDGSSARRRPD